PLTFDLANGKPLERLGFVPRCTGSHRTQFRSVQPSEPRQLKLRRGGQIPRRFDLLPASPHRTVLACRDRKPAVPPFPPNKKSFPIELLDRWSPRDAVEKRL